MAKSKIKLTKAHFRTFITMDQLAKKMKRCRSAIDNAAKRFMYTTGTRFFTKLVRTGKRGPATKAYKAVPA